jgi:hypothetical protein
MILRKLRIMNKLSRYAVTPSKLLRWAAEGRGTGEGASYKPLLTVHDVPSKGLRVRAWSAKLKRIVHLLSRLEYLFFLILEHDPAVLDVFEQYALALQKTKAIARRLGIAHPWDRKTRCLVPMSTDFVYLKIVDGRPHRFARNLKYRRDLARQRTIEKITIEQTYWEDEPDVDYGIVTEREIPRDLVRNLEWLHDALRPDYLAGIEEFVPMVEAFLRPRVEAEDTPLADLTDQADMHFGLEPGSSLAVVKWLLAHNRWRADLKRLISPLTPLHLETPPHVAIAI